MLGDASNYHHTLARGLERQGCVVTVASDGSRFMETPRDIDLSRREGRAGGAMLWARLLLNRGRWLSGYDVVSINGACFMQLRPERLIKIVRYLKAHNGRLFKTALATDTYYVQECRDPSSPLAYNEWRVGPSATEYARSHQQLMDEWLAPSLVAYHKEVNRLIEGSATALYEYQLSEMRAMPGGNVEYTGIPVDTEAISYRGCTASGSEPLRVLIPSTPGRAQEKGVDLFEAAVESVMARRPGRLEPVRVNGVTFNEFVDIMAACDIVLDQVYSYTPATTALMAMAMGKTVFTGAEADYLDFIGHRVEAPMINALPDVNAIAAELERLVDKPSRLHDIAPAARRFVETHNAADVVARRALEFWSR